MSMWLISLNLLFFIFQLLSRNIFSIANKAKDVTFEIEKKRIKRKKNKTEKE